MTYLLPSRIRGITRSALRALWRARLRSMLILLAAALGVAGVTASSTYTAMGRQKVLTQLGQLGSNVIVISPRAARRPGTNVSAGTLAHTLLLRDYNAIERNVDGLSAMSATSTGTYLVKAGDLSKNNAAILGTEAAYFGIRNWKMRAGRYFDAAEDRRMARVAVLGAGIARDLFGSASGIGDRLFINRVPFDVIGVLTEFGQDLDGGDADNTVYVPLRTQMHRLSNRDYYNGITASVANWQDMDEVAGDIGDILSRTHKPLANEPVDYQILNQRTLVDDQMTASRRLGRYVRAVSAGALIISGLGIFAICWTSVSERAGEIGLRRAVGATKLDIFLQFLLEAALLGFAGGAAGTALSVGGMLAFLKNARPLIGVGMTLAALIWATAFFLNLAFASLPAYRAARLDPIRCLRPV